MTPKQEAIFKRLKTEFGHASDGIKSLCPTIWMVKADSILSILNNYSFLIKTFQEDLKTSTMPLKMKSCLNGMICIMGKFSSYFDFKLAHSVLRHTDNLAKNLQSKDLSAVQG